MRRRWRGWSVPWERLVMVRADIVLEMRLAIGALDGKPPSDGEIGSG
jgi:hypothetical protein